MPFNTTNNAQAPIKTGISASSVTVVLETGYGSLFPSVFPFRGTIEKFDASGRVVKRNIVECTGRSGDILTIVRGVEACPISWDSLVQETTALSFDAGDIFTSNATSGIFTQMQADIASLNATIASILMVPSGSIRAYAGYNAPTGYLLCDGSAVSRTTYSGLRDIISPTKGNFSVTIATPGVITLNGHGLKAGDQFYATTTGALPTGMAVNTLYYVSATGLTANTFQFSASRGGASINTTGTQSGVHTLVFCPFGLGDGSTTFNLPNLKGVVPVGFDVSQTEFSYLGRTGGAKTHTLTLTEIPSHTHGIVTSSSGNTSAPNVTRGNLSDGSAVTGSAGGDGAHNNLQPYISLNYIIKT